MKKVVETYKGWRQSRPSLIGFVLLFAALAYILASLAIDSGSWLHYFATFAAIWLCVDSVVATLRFKENGKK